MNYISYLWKFYITLTNISILIGPLGEKNASIEAVTEEISWSEENWQPSLPSVIHEGKG